jgi:hypothetical protein
MDKVQLSLREFQMGEPAKEDEDAGIAAPRVSKGTGVFNGVGA